MAMVRAARLHLLAWLLLAPAIAHAQQVQPWELSAGGGVSDFVQDTASHVTRVGGAWDVRIMYGAWSLVAGELAYVGTANGLAEVMAPYALNGSILSSALEADLRLQLPDWIEYRPVVRPFVFFGVGVNSFDLVHEAFRNPMAIAASDASFVVPFGGGLEVALPRGFALEGRYTYRGMFDDELLHVNAQGAIKLGSQPGMSQQTFTARLAYRF